MKLKHLGMFALAGLLLTACGNAGTPASSEVAGSSEKAAGGEPRTLVISDWGLSEDFLREKVYAPFEKKFNVKIVTETGTTAERYTKLKEDPNSTVDVIGLSQKSAADGMKDGLFLKVDGLKNVEDLIQPAKELTKDGSGPAYTINSIGIIYDPEAVGFEIKEWADLWKPELANSIAIPNISTTFGPATVVMAETVAGGDYTKDQGKAGFAQLEKLKPNVVKTYSKSSDLALLFANGEIKAAIVGDFGVPVIAKASPNVKYVVPASGTFANFNTLNIAKNSKNEELAREYINYRLSVEVQLQNAGVDTLNEAPTNAKVELSEKDAANKTYGDVAKNAKPLDYSIINPLMADWTDQFNRIMNQQ